MRWSAAAEKMEALAAATTMRGLDTGRGIVVMRHGMSSLRKKI